MLATIDQYRCHRSLVKYLKKLYKNSYTRILNKIIYVLYEHQCGFRKHKATVQALLNHMQFMYGSTDSCNFLYLHVFFRLEATVRF